MPFHANLGPNQQADLPRASGPFAHVTLMPVAERVLGIGCLLAVLGLTVLGTTSAADEIARDAGEAFFERRIRPALIEHCLDCHSDETEVSGGLSLDSRQGWSSGGDLGPAVVPGDTENSLLMRAIRYDDPNLQMPPDGKLDDETIAAFERWVAGGAVDPRVATGSDPKPQTGLPVERAEEHWAYRPVVKSANRDSPANTTEADTARDEPGSIVDTFLDQRLAEVGLSAADRASRRALVRRLTFDLTGLSPTPQQIRSFVHDDSPHAYRRLVDRLLASHHFGEHFARRWMDVARYAESVTLRGLVIPQAWRYRDYLVMAYAEDRPFDRMIREQIAGDLLPRADVRERQWSSIATGFLAMGNSNLEDQDKTKLDFDHIDEQLETIGRAFLGQTIGCARCHDHKFDPIPTADYYAMAGILRSTTGMEHSNVSRWIERDLPLSDDETRRYEQLSRDRRRVEAELKELEAADGGPTGRRVAMKELRGVVIDDDEAKLVGEWSTSSSVPHFVGDGYRHDGNRDQGEKTATFEPKSLKAGRHRVRIAYTANPNRASNVQVQVFSANESVTLRVNQRKRPREDGLWHTLGEFPFEEEGQAYVMVSNEGANGHVVIDAVQFVPADEVTRATAEAPDDEALAERAKRLAELKRQQREIEAELNDRPEFLTVVEADPMDEIEIRIRGNVHSLGEPVSRGFLSAVPPAEELSDRIPPDQSGRVELAEWIADPRNPLTARVYANRVWSWLMGDGLVATENNFGTTGAAPTHPELLDRLAVELTENGWSTKQLVRTIVSSEAYRRRIVVGDHPGRAIDPDNRLRWSAHLKRIPVEAMRDAMLCVSGELDRRVGGSQIHPGTGSDYRYRHQAGRRSLYDPVFRNSLPPLFEVFDFADTSVSVGSRNRSTVPTQSLALMNHPWVIERARAAAELWQPRFDSADKGPLTELYEAAVGRPPTQEELEISLEYLHGSTHGDAANGDSNRVGSIDRARLEGLIQTLFASPDFRFLD